MSSHAHKVRTHHVAEVLNDKAWIRDRSSSVGSVTLWTPGVRSKALDKASPMHSAGRYSFSAVVRHRPQWSLPMEEAVGSSFRRRQPCSTHMRSDKFTTKRLVGLGEVAPSKPWANASAVRLADPKLSVRWAASNCRCVLIICRICRVFWDGVAVDHRQLKDCLKSETEQLITDVKLP